jgi:dihydroorotase
MLKLNPRNLESILNKNPPFGNTILETIKKLPKFKITLEKETDKLNATVVRQEQSTTIMKQFTVVHDIFHEVAGMCKGDEKK